MQIRVFFFLSLNELLNKSRICVLFCFDPNSFLFLVIHLDLILFLWMFLEQKVESHLVHKHLKPYELVMGFVY